MKGRLSLCVSTQTPLARFKANLGEIYNKYGEVPEPLPIEMLAEGEDYSYAPGGVTRLLPSMFRDLLEKDVIRKPHWISLNPLGPETALTEVATLHSINLPPHESARYGRFKEAIWKNVHDIEKIIIPREDFPGYALYNWLTAKKMLDLHSEHDFDLFYVHDFQLLSTGSMLGPSAPKLFRWHVPLNMQEMLPQWRKFFLNYLHNYDGVIVSCEKYKESLSKAGYSEKIYHLYPHIDPDGYSISPQSEINKFCEEYEINEDDEIILVIARLDPMKGQDIAIKGLSQIAKKHPEAKLLLVGNGSFSSSNQGGLGLSKGLRWKRELETLASRLGISDRITFTGFMPDKDLETALTRADILILPSILEGFGLTVLEGWEYKKPVIVSSEAGVSELVKDGKNGYTFNPSNPGELSEKMDKILSDSDRGKELGKRGHETVEKCYLERASKKLKEIFNETISK